MLIRAGSYLLANVNSFVGEDINHLGREWCNGSMNSTHESAVTESMNSAVKPVLGFVRIVNSPFLVTLRMTKTLLVDRFSFE